MQEIRFFTTPDNVRIAYATVGQGFPLVKAANWLTHLEFEWRSPVWRHWLKELAGDHRLVRYDERGTGLSDWKVEDLSFSAWGRDLEGVVEAAGLERFDLLGISQGGPVAIAYAARHPEHVSHLILYGTFAQGPSKWSNTPEQRARDQALVTLTKQGWGQDNPAYRQLWTSLFMPDATPEQMRWFNELQRVSTSPENAVRFLIELSKIDVLELLLQVRVPTLVLHCQDDQVVPFDEGRRLATLIPGARFVPLQGRNHLPQPTEPAWEMFQNDVRHFLGTGRASLAAHEEAANSFLEKGATRLTTLAPGAKLGTYEIVEFVGAGGMGEVYRARDSILGREVAIKILPSVFSRDPDRLRRFEKEARAAAALNHPNILSIHQLGTEDGSPYVVSEFLEGETIRLHLQRGAVPVEKAIDYTLQLVNGLAAAHEKGIIHRDLKPENLFLTTSGWLKILDFGLAKLRSPQEFGAPETAMTLANGTAPGVVMGTVGYMSPEQVRSQQVDGRSDIFAVGSILHEMLSGRRAFEGHTGADMMAAILAYAPPTLVGTSPNITPALDGVVRRCLEKDPAARFQSAKEVELALKALSVVASAERGAARPRQAKIRPRILLVAALVLIVILGLLVAANFGRVRNRLWAHAGSPQIRSLAVLPLTNLSGDPGQDYFADGTTEAMITELAQISALRVISRTSVMHYKDTKKTVPEIARELHVDGVLEGSVLRSGSKVRITAQLIQAVPERHLWARNYDRELRDMMTVQSDVASSVAEEIRIKVTPQEESRLGKPRLVNPEAQDAYLRARYYRRRGNRNDLEKAREYFEQALEKDPLYAPAYGGLADYYSVLPFYTNTRSGEVRPKAKAAVARALELDDSLAEAHAELAYIDTYYDWDWADADREFQRALQLNPNDAAVRHRYSRYLSTLGRIDEALREIKRAQELDPLSLLTAANVGVIYYFGRQYDAAMNQLQNVLKEDPKFDTAHWGLGLVYEQKGMSPEAVAEMEKAAALSRDSNTLASLGHAYAIAGQKQKAEKILKELESLRKTENVSGYQFALLFVGLGERDRAFEALENAFQERSTLLTYIKMDPRFDPLRSDPRFQQIVRLIGLPA